MKIPDITIIAFGLIVAWCAYLTLEIHSHNAEIGHIGLQERINGMETSVHEKIVAIREDIAEIKSDLKLLLHNGS